MSSSSEKRQISITVDAQLLDEIDKLSNQATGQNASDRSLVFEEALRLGASQMCKSESDGIK
jgi:metal-responsive CopG/Arc/MetJ family transcriptional regulator